MAERTNGGDAMQTLACRALTTLVFVNANAEDALQALVDARRRGEIDGDHDWYVEAVGRLSGATQAVFSSSLFDEFNKAADL